MQFHMKTSLKTSLKKFLPFTTFLKNLHHTEITQDVIKHCTECYGYRDFLKHCTECYSYPDLSNYCTQCYSYPDLSTAQNVTLYRFHKTLWPQACTVPHREHFGCVSSCIDSKSTAAHTLLR